MEDHVKVPGVERLVKKLLLYSEHEIFTMARKSIA